MTKKASLLPAPGYILVEPLEGERRTPSGIVLPESHEEKPSKGKILSLGSAPVSESGKPLPVWSALKKGAIIVYKKWAGNEYKPEGEDRELLFVKYEDVLAVEA